MPRRFTLSDLSKTPAARFNQHLLGEQPKPAKRAKGVHMTVMYFIRIIEALQLPYELEYRFHTERKWRFDLALPDRKLAIEYEGLMSEKSRHTTARGYTGDADKYNAAQALGWTVLRYTALNWKQFESDLLNIINK